MKRSILAIVAVLLAAVGVRAQSGFTTVSATVLDPTGVPYAGCSGNASFVPSPSATTFPTIGGSTFPTTAVIAACDSFGAFTLVLADNNQVVDGHTSPPASQWRFTISAQGGSPSFACTMTITGTTQNISSQMQACAAPLPTPKANSFASVTTQQSATPTFTGNGNTGFIYLLNQNVTSSTFTTNAAAGTSPVYQFNICQDSVGGHTMVWPSNVILPANYVFNLVPNSCSPVSFIFNPNTGTWTPWQVIAPLGASLPFSTVTFTATPSFFGTPTGVAYGITLTGNVTSSTVSGAPANGNVMKFHICQGGGGPWTFAFPANFLNTTAIQNTGCTDETYSFDGTNWTQLTQPASGGGGGGGSCSAAGSQGTLQAAGTAGACQTTNLSETGSKLTVNDDVVFQGQNPYVDIRSSGAVAVTSNAVPFIAGITATCNGTTTVTISSASTFVNGQGVAVQGCGATNTMSTPSAPTVASSLASAPPGSGYVVNGATGGSETTCYKVVARDKGQGITAASSETCVTGQTRGTQVVALTSCVRSAGTLVTCTTSSSHTLTPGTWVKVNGTSNDPEYAGYFILTSVPDTTHFAFQNNRSSLAGATTVAATGGNVTYMQCNHITFPAATAGVWQYAVYRGASGAETLADVSVIVTSGINQDSSYLTWDDFGTSYTTVPNLPAFWPSSAPGSASNDTLVTTISSGAGTTTLTLANAASQSISGVTILSDNAPNIKAAFTAANSNKGMVYIPALSSGVFGTNSILDLSAFNGIGASVAGQLWLGDTLITNGVWHGDLVPASLTNTQFQLQYLTPLSINAKPGIYINTGTFTGLSFNPQGTNCQSIFVAPGSIPTALFYNDAFRGSPSGADFSCVPVTLFTQGQAGSSAAGITFRDVFFNGPAQGLTPFLISKNFGELTFDGVMQAGRGMLFSNCPTCTITGITFNQRYENQGPAMPLFVTRGTIGLSLNGVIEDTGSQPIVAHLGPGPLQVSGVGSAPSSGMPAISGANIQAIVGAGLSDLQQGVNINYTSFLTGLVYDGFYNSTQAFSQQNAQFALGPNYSIFSNGGTYAAPTCTITTAGPPFSFSNSGAGTYTLAYTPVYANGGQGIPSGKVNCTVDGATQQATINIPTPIFGAIGYRLLWGTSGGLGNYFLPTYTTTSILVPNGVGNTQGQSQPAFPGGGPAGMVNGQMWSNTMNLGQYVDILETTAPANPTIASDRLYADSTTHKLNCLTTTGANCLFPYAINSYSGNHVLITSEQAAVATASGITFTLPHAAAGRAWDIYNTSGGTITLTIDSGTLSGGGATGPITIASNTGVRASCDGTNCDVLGVGGGGGGGCTPGGITDALQYNGGGTCSFGGVNSPTVNGNYIVNYNVTAGAAVPPTINLPGVPVNAQTGTTYTIGAANTFNDRATVITATNSGAQTYSMVNPTNTGFGSNMPYTIWNRGTGTVTENASGFTVNGGASLLIPPNWVAPHWSDGVNWIAPRYPSFEAWPSCLDSGGNHLNFNTSTGAIICGTSASGNGLSGMTAGQVPIAATATSVTSSEALAGAGAAITTGPASSTSLDVVEFTGTGGQIADAGFLASNVVRKDAAATLGAFLYDFSASTMKIPTGAGFTASASSMIGYDSTNKNIHIFQNAADSINCSFASAPSNNNVIIATVASSNVLCTGVTAIPNGTTGTTQAVDDNSTKLATTAYVDRMNMRSLGWGFGDLATGSALTTSEVGYITVPFACTITGWHIMADAGTVTIKTARVNGGTALPTVGSNSISTSGVSLSTGTKIDSTTVTDFTSTAIAVNDTLGFFITTVATAKQITFQLDCQQ